MAQFDVTMKVVTLVSFKVEAADFDEAREVAVESPMDEVEITDTEITREITEIALTDEADETAFDMGRYADRPMDTDYDLGR